VLNRVRTGDVVVVGDRNDIQLELVDAGCSVLVVSDGMPVGSDVIEAAEKKGTLVLSSPHHAFATVQLMTMSEPVEGIMNTTGPTVGLYTPIADLRNICWWNRNIARRS